MTAPRHCAACARALDPGGPYYRFAIALEGEQDVVDRTGAPAREELAAVLAELEAGPEDPTHWDEQVHWERSGVVCPGCRSRLVALFGGAAPSVH